VIVLVDGDGDVAVNADVHDHGADNHGQVHVAVADHVNVNAG
jgi:hypothetical protein